MYFHHCHTPDELHLQYRSLAKKLHPDTGGDKEAFQQMQNEYEQRKIYIQGNKEKNTLPAYFSPAGHYQYFRRKVTYTRIIYDYYYKFIQDFGADILIDIHHTHLIFEVRPLL